MQDLYTMDRTENEIFELTRDIDATGFNTMLWAIRLTLNGNGYRIYNLSKPLFSGIVGCIFNDVHLLVDMTSSTGNLGGFAQSERFDNTLGPRTDADLVHCEFHRCSVVGNLSTPSYNAGSFIGNIYSIRGH